MNVYLIDGTYELFRAHFGGPPGVTRGGRDVAAARTFTRSMLSLLRDPTVTHVGCAFDHVIESFRNDLFDGYKTGEGLPAELTGQFELVELASRALGLATWPMVPFEADDAIATMAARAAADDRVDRVFLASPDKDLCQCVRGDRVVLLDRMRRKIVNAAGVLEKFGVTPEQIPDYLALVGDDADGIPGVPGFGAKTAAAVLRAYGTVETIPRDPAAWTVGVRGAPRLAAALAAAGDAVGLYKTLATLRTDVPLEETVDALAYRGPDRALLAELVLVLEDPAIEARVDEVLAERANPSPPPS